MKIGVLYICTGKYSIFWDSFYKSSEMFFLPEAVKHYFVFTDDTRIISKNRVHVKPESPKGFPLDSLLRFDMFLSIQDQLLEMDYIYFFNSNMKFVQNVGLEIVPLGIDSGLVAVMHPGYFNKGKMDFLYERNTNSKAFIKYSKKEEYYYLMGGVNGGKTSEYLKLCKICSNNIQVDMKNNIMAIYHDESHLNQYLHGKNILMLSPEFGFPEDSEIPFNPKILILNKMKHGGVYFDKLPQKAYALRFYLKIKRTYRSLIWKYL